MIPVIFVLTLVNSDINLTFKKIQSQNVTANKITVFNWNTEFWEKNKKSEFFAHLQSQDVDIYQLQEFMEYDEDGELTTPNDLEKLQALFPDYTIVHNHELLVISKYPIISSTKEESFFRNDISINGQIVSFYNVHIPVQLDLAVSNPLNFLQDVKERFSRREKSFLNLEVDLKYNAHKKYISGDFNSTKSMGKMDYLLTNFVDSFIVSDSLVPATWETNHMKLWRIDYNLLSKDLTLLKHQNVNPQKFSDHWGQKVTFSL